MLYNFLLLAYTFIKRENYMGFSRDANFIITVDQTPFNSQFDEFNQILKDFSNSAILEDILDIPLPDDSGFRKQFELVAKLIRSNQFAHLLFPVKGNLIDWTEIVDTRELYNPYQTFIVIQFVYFISRKFPSKEVDFVIGYKEEYTRFIKLMDGKIISKQEEQLIEPVEMDANLLEISLKDLVIMLKYFNSL
jgi:hypothetical protein